MEISNQIPRKDLIELSYKMDGYNEKLRSENQGSKNTLMEADFLKLMITQLKTQDPTKPLDDNQFIGQMAQFTSLKQMNELTSNFKNLTKEFTFTKAISLVNKIVSWTDVGGRMSEGMVQSIRVRNGEAFLNVDGMEVSMSQLDEVKGLNAKTDAPDKK